MSGQQQTIYTIHESQLNNVAGGQFHNGDGQHRNSNSEVLIDTSSIPMTHQAPMPPMQHHQHLQPTPVAQTNDAVTSQPGHGQSQAGASSSSTSGRVAPESQSIVYSVHPIFGMLDQHDALLVRQRADCTSTCCGFESVNTYTVRAKDGSPVLKAIENSNCCERCCFETNREYNLSLVHGDEVVARIRKPYRVSRFCCYSNAVQIESPEDNPIGFIRQLSSFFGHPRYAIYDCQQPPKTASFYLESTSCRFCCTPLLCTCICGNREFRVVSAETGDEVGTITRHWSNNRQQQAQAEESAVEGEGGEPAGGDSNPFGGGAGGGGGSQLFGVQFTADLEARQKVLLLSACFMMDFFYFENDRRRRKLASC